MTIDSRAIPNFDKSERPIEKLTNFNQFRVSKEKKFSHVFDVSQLRLVTKNKNDNKATFDLRISFSNSVLG